MLPTTSYVKIIDIWMIFCMLVPFSEVLLHAVNQTLKDRIDDLKTQLDYNVHMERWEERFIGHLI